MALTVGDVRKAIAGAPDSMPVVVRDCYFSGAGLETDIDREIDDFAITIVSVDGHDFAWSGHALAFCLVNEMDMIPRRVLAHVDRLGDKLAEQR